MVLSPVRDTTVVAGALKLHYAQWGENGTPVVCLHGLTANAFSFQALADDLARDHRVIAYDLRGRGDSEKPERGYSIPIHAADLLALMDTLGLERPALVGWSLGALISLYFAAHHPERVSKLVLVDAGAPIPWKTVEDQPPWLTAAVSRLGTPVPSFEEYKQRLKAAPFLGPYWNEYLELYFHHDVYRQPDGSVVSKAYREGILEEGNRSSEAPPEEQWAQIRTPTLLLRAGQGLFAENDQLMTEAGTEAAHQAIHGSQVVNFPTLNHYTILFGVQPGPVAAIHAFLDGQ